MITKGQSTTSIPKRQKPIEETQMEIQTLEDDHIDRISELPNSILCHILSFLPTKFAVGTSILSTRWKNIFASIPNHNLVFDDTLILYPKHQSKSISSASRTSFVDFVYGVLTIILRDVLDHKNILPEVSYVNSFSLNCKQDHGHLHINAWINALAWANVEELFLRITLKNSNLLHSSLFGCTSVVKLSLGWNVLLEVPDSVYFPNLKFLSLDYVKFIDGDSSYRFINGCPILEELCIDNCEWGDMEVLIILVPSLKRLYLENCFSDSDYEILLDTPALEYFFCYDYLADSYMVNDMSSLVEAHLDVGLSEEQLDEEEDLSLYSQKVAILVTACSNVEYLYLSGAAIEAIHYSSCAMPTFHKLSQLKLGGMDFHGWKLLPHILERSPNLQVLVFTRGFFVFKDCYHIFKNHLHENVPVCVSLHLQEIRFVEFKGEDDELRLVEYFLDNSKVLKKLEISTYMSLERHSSISKKILMLPRSSKTCQIVLT